MLNTTPDLDIRRVAECTSRVGFSLLGIVLSMSCGGATLIVMTLLSLRRRPSGSAAIPLASTCSVAVRAACHPPEDDREPWRMSLRYGTTSLRDGDGHCCFAMARDVRPSISRVRYSWATVRSLVSHLHAEPWRVFSSRCRYSRILLARVVRPR